MPRSQQDELRKFERRLFDERERYPGQTADIEVERSRICAVVVTFNSEKWLEGCFQGLVAQAPIPVDIVVVDNGSSDGTLAGLERFAESLPLELTVLRQDKNSGYAAACNVGIRWAIDREYDYVLIMNPDVTLKSRALAEMMDVHRSAPSAGPVTSLHVSHTEPRIEAGCLWFMGYSEPLVAAVVAGKPLERWYPTPAISGALMLISTELIRTVGLFDELFFFYGEDLDYCRRCVMLGYTPVVAIRAHACHWHPTFRGMDAFRRSNFRRAGYLLMMKKPSRPFVVSVAGILVQAIRDCWEFGVMPSEVRQIAADVGAALCLAPAAFRARARDLLRREGHP
jgi:GT2 family glycosyltransferase